MKAHSTLYRFILVRNPIRLESVLSTRSIINYKRGEVKWDYGWRIPFKRGRFVLNETLVVWW